MLQNSLVLVGRLNNTPNISGNGDERYTVVELRLTESEEVLSVFLYRELAENVVKYCTEGDIMGVRGHLKVENGVLSIIADKVTFLANKNKEESDEDE